VGERGTLLVRGRGRKKEGRINYVVGSEGGDLFYKGLPIVTMKGRLSLMKGGFLWRRILLGHLLLG